MSNVIVFLQGNKIIGVYNEPLTAVGNWGPGVEIMAFPLNVPAKGKRLTIISGERLAYLD